ncbi:MAG: DUF362 domain-containing protein [Candidatus Lokiarchaeota archaeon]|nr:DUF362 domain-containing protein [Candidatus Lokiarchaeota archaeon]
MERPKVILKTIPVDPGSGPGYLDALSRSVAAILDAFGGGSMLKSSKAVYLKPNAIDTKPFVYTRPELLECVINYFKDAGADHIYVMENSTQSNYTRIVFDGVGYAKVCRRTGAIPIYLDEQRNVRMEFSRDPRQARAYDSNVLEVPRILVDKLVDHKDDNLYVNLPKLKTHSMGVVTLGIKNQWAFPAHSTRKHDHNYNLHAKLVDVLELIQPDFTLIEGIEGTIHGHYPLEAFHDRVIKPFRLLIGSPNVLAADIVGAKVFGIPARDVPSLKIAMERKLCGGIQGLDDFEVDGNLSGFSTRHDHDIVQAVPPNVNVVKGKSLLCREGCLNNPLMVAQLFHFDHGAKGRCDLVIGKGHDPEAIDRLRGPVVVAGHCAVDEVGQRLRQRLGKANVFLSDGCNNLRQTNVGLARFMGVNLLKLVPSGTLKSLWLLFQARLHGSTANVPSIREVLTRFKVVH